MGKTAILEFSAKQHVDASLEVYDSGLRYPLVFTCVSDHDDEPTEAVLERATERLMDLGYSVLEWKRSGARPLWSSKVKYDKSRAEAQAARSDEKDEA